MKMGYLKSVRNDTRGWNVLSTFLVERVEIFELFFGRQIWKRDFSWENTIQFILQWLFARHRMIAHSRSLARHCARR